jgi:endogenous inhibitor of DNA gyrase (YacG/DUF329 family)
MKRQAHVANKHPAHGVTAHCMRCGIAVDWRTFRDVCSAATSTRPARRCGSCGRTAVIARANPCRACDVMEAARG